MVTNSLTPPRQVRPLDSRLRTPRQSLSTYTLASRSDGGSSVGLFSSGGISSVNTFARLQAEENTRKAAQAMQASLELQREEAARRARAEDTQRAVESERAEKDRLQQASDDVLVRSGTPRSSAAEAAASDELARLEERFVENSKAAGAAGAVQAAWIARLEARVVEVSNAAAANEASAAARIALLEDRAASLEARVQWAIDQIQGSSRS